MTNKTHNLNFVEAIDFCNLMISLHTLPIRVFGLEMTPAGIYNDFEITLDLPLIGNRARYFVEDNIEALVETAEVPSDPSVQLSLIKKPCRVFDGNVTFWTNLKFYLYFCMEANKEEVERKEKEYIIRVSKQLQKGDADWNEISEWYDTSNRPEFVEEDTQARGFNMIVARHGHGIGKDNGLPWDIPRDLKHFREKTQGKKLIMGRKTYDSILERNGEPLEGRDHLVVTTSLDFSYKFTNSDGSTNIVRTISPESVKKLENKEGYFIIGGGQTYESFLHLVSTIYETQIIEPAIAYDFDAYIKYGFLDGFKQMKTEWAEGYDRNQEKKVDLLFSTYKSVE